MGEEILRAREGDPVLEGEQPAVEDRLEARDLLVRLVAVLGLVGAALALLLAIHPA